jgi:hypothetical protein
MNQVLQKGTFSIYPAQAAKGLPALEQVLLIWLWQHANSDTGESFPSLKMLAKEAGMSLESAKRKIKELEKRGFIEIKHRRRKDGTRTSNLYRVLIPERPDVVSKGHDQVAVRHDQGLQRHYSELKPDNQNQITKTTTTYNVAETTVSDPTYGNDDINLILKEFKQVTGLNKLDGSIKENRRYAWLCRRKFGSARTVVRLIELATMDEFHRQNLTSLKYVYYNGMKFAAKAREKVINPNLVVL